MEELSDNSSVSSIDTEESTYISFIESKRLYNLSISLTQFNKLSFESIRTAIIELNSQFFSEEQLEILIKFIPTQQELAQLKHLLSEEQQ